MKEIWKSIVETNGKYEISNYGRLRTIDHNAKNRHNEKRFVKGKLRKGTYHNGYLIYAFYLEGKRWAKYAHHLVWQYFGNGERSNHRITLDHIDNDKGNNRIDNLQLITSRDNTSKGFKNKKIKTSKFIGVHWLKKKQRWIARILFGNKRIHLGSFRDENEAGEAYQYALSKIKNGVFQHYYNIS